MIYLIGCLASFIAGFSAANMMRFNLAMRELKSLKKKPDSYDESLINFGISKGIEKFTYPFWPRRSKQEFKEWLKKEGIKW